MPNDLPRAKLDNFWLEKVYKVHGKPFTFFWGVTALGWDDAIRMFTRSAGMKDYIDKRPAFVSWREADSHCRITIGADRPKCETGENFSVKDDQIRKPLPKQIVFNLT